MCRWKWNLYSCRFTLLLLQTELQGFTQEPTQAACRHSKCFLHYSPFVWRMHWSLLVPLTKSHYCGGLMVSLVLAWTKWRTCRWVGSDLRSPANPVASVCCEPEQRVLTGVSHPSDPIASSHPQLNSSPPGQNDRHLSDDIFKYISMNEKILILISLKFVPMSPIDNMSALVQVMVWCWTGSKPLPEPILTKFTDAYMQH